MVIIITLTVNYNPMKVIDIKPPYEDWKILVEDLEDLDKSNYIFRGQSNYSPNDFKRWDIISSFNRYYRSNHHKFSNFLAQQLETGLFKYCYGKYSYGEINYLKKCTILEKVYFLQHYGIPTCFIDFTKDPLIALYFAMAEIRGNSGGKISQTGKNELYHPNFYISVYALNHKLMIDQLGVHTITKEFNLIGGYHTYGYQEKDRIKRDGYFLGLDLYPLENIENPDENYNLKNQEGCFVLYDNEGNGKCLSQHLEERINNISEPIIIEYRLDFNSVLKHYYRDENPNNSLYKYLDQKQKTGRFLFNDIQGLKYDLNFFVDHF